MDKAEFDQFADEYRAIHINNISASGESPEYFARYKITDVAGEVARRGLAPKAILDFGSGIGNSLQYLAEAFPRASLMCADVSRRSLDVSRMRFPDIRASYVEIPGDRLPFEDGAFDVAFSACVFHHIPHDEHVHWLAELRRVTRPGGMLLIYEHNPLNPVTVSAVRNCPFDANARLITAGTFRDRVRAAGWGRVRISFRVFFPHALAFARPLERFLRRVPVGAQYFVVADCA